jgi:hypothetical protein
LSRLRFAIRHGTDRATALAVLPPGGVLGLDYRVVPGYHKERTLSAASPHGAFSFSNVGLVGSNRSSALMTLTANERQRPRQDR